MSAETKQFDILELDLGPYHLRQARESDRDELVKQYNEELIVKWMGLASPFLDENFEPLLKFFAADQERGGGCWWVIEQDGVIQGQIWFRRQDWTWKKSELGYMAFAPSRGKGMIPFLVRQLAEIALKDYGMNRVEICCATDNENSSRAAEKAGFKYEGISRKEHIQRGVALDQKIYSLIAEDLD
ncbi:MAG: hypothetical protein RLZZ164_1171 [Actinomycetota bacterium]|jgi:ribosomal-protein-serine acetyltransferase